MESQKQFNHDIPAGQNWKKTAGIVGALLIVTIGVSAWIISSQNSKHRRTAEAMQTQLSTLEDSSTTLTGELQTLEGQYASQIAENTSLQSDLNAKIAEVESLQTKVRSAQSQLSKSKASADEIKGKLAQLEELKGELEKDVARLTGENTALSETNQMLTETVTSAKRDIAMLNERVSHLTTVNTQLNQRLASIAPAGFTADHFMISAQKRNDRLTSKASRADVINVSFTLSDVPENYAEPHNLYLVITDFDGMPLKNVPAATANIRTADNVMQVQAADTQKVKISGNQVVQMTVDPTEDLDPGNYNLVVYADNGFLGATGFQLR